VTVRTGTPKPSPLLSPHGPKLTMTVVTVVTVLQEIGERQ
jgi:hypothetical protein